ncbi:ATP-binding protein [Streptomyces sp. NPDC006393]|uniref:ATP-binding protein n=1 Tax=Streptomyces sp. NPDC006393 TaxID=3156763 RepID=UPI0033FA879B
MSVGTSGAPGGRETRRPPAPRSAGDPGGLGTGDPTGPVPGTGDPTGPVPGTGDPTGPVPGTGDPTGPGPGTGDPTRLGIDPDDLPDGLVVADAHGRVICFNAAAARITAVPAEEALGQRLEKALPLEDLEGRRWWQLTDPYGGLAIRVGQPERNLLLHGGREVLVSARYVRDRPTGPVRRVVVSLRDTEARRRTERSHAELIATVAHELRSPLTSVKGFTATLLAKWERFTDDQKRLMLETVDADADRVTRLIAELLDISRIDSGRLEVRRQLVDMKAAVGRHVQAYVAAGQPADRFLVRTEQPLPELWADPDKIDQVLSNLIENAVRHGEGTVTIDITAASSPRDGDDPRHTENAENTDNIENTATSVTVSDEGPGIPEESMNRVFTRFWRGSKRGGTGLGLYIVKGIVEAHGGTITVGRAAGGGARFRFTLPVGTPAHLL